MRNREVTRDSSSYPTRSYDLVKEFVVALVAVSLLTALLAAVFSSPDEKPITIAQWAKAAPDDFSATALSELAGTSGSAEYGAPYNHNGGEQKIGPIGLQKAAGVRHPVDTAQAFVVGPLENSPTTGELKAALAQYEGASNDQRQEWIAQFEKDAPNGIPAKVAAGAYGPLPTMITNLTELAQTGALDGSLLSEGGFYQTDYTLPLLFIADGTYLEEKATGEHLTGEQWGMMNETGNYPGQAWLWLYTLWYQVKPFSTSGNADALIWALMMVLTLAFVLVPFLPGVRSIPRWVPVYKLIWRDYYRNRADHPVG